jgi:hypothetical protein
MDPQHCLVPYLLYLLYEDVPVQEELESICSRLYERIRRLFPLLPTPDSPCWLVSPDTGEQLIVTPNTVLLPLLLPPLHPTIFTLYALRYLTVLYSCW